MVDSSPHFDKQDQPWCKIKCSGLFLQGNDMRMINPHRLVDVVDFSLRNCGAIGRLTHKSPKMEKGKEKPYHIFTVAVLYHFLI